MQRDNLSSVSCVGLLCAIALMTFPARAQDFSFNTGDPDGLIGTASRPASAGLTGKIEVESADDFLLLSDTSLESATFTGLLTGGAMPADINDVAVAIYRVFPNDSDVTRLPNVPTRTNSPSDTELESRSLSDGNLTSTSATIASSFTVGNSIVNGIHPRPGETTGGEGPQTGEEVRFSVGFTTPLNLSAGHYFFVPKVGLNNGEFLWLSAPKPITGGTPFTPDLQSWVRNADLDPDWLRAGTDVIGAGTYNASFSLSGRTTGGAIPEPGTLSLLALSGLGLLGLRRRAC